MIKDITTAIFLGPTLDVEQAKAIYPNALYLPPVQCGDILATLRLPITTIAIIDGYFQQTPAVWHKEILFALEQGVTIYGASSMGALRAAELDSYGMIGIGEIYQAYTNGEIKDDDEVAVLHAPDEKNYHVLTDAMVNIRATLIEAEQKAIISKQQQQQLLAQAKQLPYQQRSLWQIAANNDLTELSHWLKQENIIDQKQLDAIELLNLLAKAEQPHSLPKIKTHHSLYLRTLHRQIACKPFPIAHEKLSRDELVARQLLNYPREHRLCERLALLMAANYDVILSQKLSLPAAQDDIFFLHNEYSSQPEFLQRIELLQQWVSYWQHSSEKTLADYWQVILKLANEYQSCQRYAKDHNLTLAESFQRLNPQLYGIMAAIVPLWFAMDSFLLQQGVTFDNESVQRHLAMHCQAKGIATPQQLEAWIETNDLDGDSFQELLTIIARLDYYVLQNNLSQLGIEQQLTDVWWLLDSLKLSGFYETIAQT